MPRHRLTKCLTMLGAALMATALAADQPCSCTDQPCSPACKASWEEKKSSKPAYSLKCDYACARGSDCWYNPSPECRCRPPGGKVFVKKKLFKSTGKEQAERVPHYEVEMVPAEPCDCARCCGIRWWHPLEVLHYLLHHSRTS